MPQLPTAAQAANVRWEAVAARDRSADARFVYAVRTTRICCRPGCPSRLPKRPNVKFFEGPAQAEVAGFRPCRRCRPHQTRVTDPTRWRWPASFLDTNLRRLHEFGRVDARWCDEVRSEWGAAEADPTTILLTLLVPEIIAEKVAADPVAGRCHLEEACHEA